MNFKKFLALVCSFLMLVSCFGINSKATEEKNLLFKTALLGDAEAGKTKFLNRFANGQYSHGYTVTVGVYFYTKDYNVNEKSIHLQVLDTAGHERYRRIISGWYGNSHAIILCIDLTKGDFETPYKRWMNEINQYADKDSDGKLKAPVILLGTKCDLVNDDKKQQFKDFAKEKGHYYFISSAKNGCVENSEGESIGFDGFGQALCKICLGQYEEEPKGKKTKAGWSTGKILLVGGGVGAVGTIVTLATIFGCNHHKNKNKTKVPKAQETQPKKAKVATVA